VKVTVSITKSFKIAAKPLLKKYPSLAGDLLTLEKELLLTPRLGTPLGNDAYKIRLKITSKGKGKSGGARVISLVETTIIGIAEVNTEDEIAVNLLSIYDKADVGNISDKELKELIKAFKND
jgi:mRNA-degrading endonuclease RelE of RelBE toxin-antitoxin system